MNIDKIYESLDRGFDINSKRAELMTYLKDSVNELPDNDDERREIAYNIAGLLSTDFARNLSENDILEEILTLAGELEIPNQHNNKKWLQLINLVNKL